MHAILLDKVEKLDGRNLLLAALSQDIPKVLVLLQVQVAQLEVLYVGGGERTYHRPVASEV